jgi:hypothetical protein
MLVPLALLSCSDDPAGHGANPPTVAVLRADRQPAAEDAGDPATFDWMFSSPSGREYFGRYVRNADGIALAEVLSRTPCQVRVLKTLAGPLVAGTLVLKPTGGFSEVQEGQLALVLWSRDGNGFSLHSFCGASGLYPATPDRLALVQRHLRDPAP